MALCHYDSSLQYNRKERAMGVLYDALESLASEHDPELADGFHRYEDAVEKILSPAQIAVYAADIRQTGEIRLFDELSPAEIEALSPDMAAIAADILADRDVSMENRRVVALLSQRGEEEIIPDFHDTPIATESH
jgi:hypothetical protein